MKPLTIANAAVMTLALQDEIRRSEDARYDHRLHGVLLVAEGLSCPQTARLLGDAPRSVQLWVHRFEARGLSGLQETPRPGRPPRLSPADLRAVGTALRRTPADYGLGPTCGTGRPWRRSWSGSGRCPWASGSASGSSTRSASATGSPAP